MEKQKLKADSKAAGATQELAPNQTKANPTPSNQSEEGKAAAGRKCGRASAACLLAELGA